MSDLVKIENLKNLIIEIRDKTVLLDTDVAVVYGVETKRINEAVKNNPEKFPDGYVLELNKSEWDSLKSKFSTSMKGGKVKLPSAFTEKGLYMLATILKSTQAIEATLSIIETFSKIRELPRNALRNVLVGWVLRKVAVPISKNLRTEVVEQLAYIREWGGQFVTAVPVLEIK